MATQMSQATTNRSRFCSICYKDVCDATSMSCLNPRCSLRSHIVCLANVFLEPGAFIPIDGDCPECHKHMLWGDLVRKRNGCCDWLDADSNDEIIISDVDDDD